jgi:hypothetical protein
MKSVIWAEVFIVLIDRHLVFKLLTKGNSRLHKEKKINNNVLDLQTAGTIKTQKDTYSSVVTSAI